MSSPLEFGLAADLAARGAFGAERRGEYGHTATICAILAAERVGTRTPPARPRRTGSPPASSLAYRLPAAPPQDEGSLGAIA